jgi:ABC-type branched-subunit amino acid transport system ATPase component/branched-subunit amino acid ABC-type transport system permease component
VEKLWNLVLSGAVTGAIYSIMASGLVLTFQTSGIFNFAHGAIAFTTAFFYYQLHSGQGVPIVPAAILSVLVFAPLLGLALDYVLLRRLATAPVYARIVGTIGLLVALPALALWLVEAVGDSALNLGLPKVSDTASVGGIAPGLGPQPPEILHISSGVNLSTDQLAVFVAAAIAAFTLWFIIRRTRVGLQMRAVVDRESLASLRAVNPARTSAFAWILTMILAGLGGVLIAPLFQLNDTLFTLVVLGSLFAVVVSGVLWGYRAALPVAFIGGLVLGIVQNLVAGYSDDILPAFLNKLSGFRSSIPFLLVVVVLLVIGRDRGRAAGTVADDAPLRDHREGLSAWRRRLPWAIFTIALLAYALQWIDVSWLQADSYEQSLIAGGLATAMIFLSFVVVTGLGGMVSLAQATFVTTGGFAAGWALNRDWGIDAPFVASHGQINFVWALVIGTLAAAVLGAIVAIPVRHLGPVALAIMTFAIAFVLDLIAFDYEPIAKGSLGWSIRSPTLDVPGLNQVVDWLVPGSQDKLDLSDPAMQVLAFLAIFGLLVLVLHSLQRSASGRAMLAVRSTEVAAATSGISPARTKTLIFALSAAIAGFGGVLLGVVNFSVGRTTAPPLIGLVWLAVAVTFGVRRPGGALLAGLSFVCTTTIFTWIGNDYLSGAFKDLTTSVQFTAILFGLGAINLAKNPDGLLALIGHQRIDRRVERERKARIAEAEAAAHGGEVPEHERDHARPTTTGAPAEGVTTSRSTVAESATPGSAIPGTRDAALRLEHIVAGYGQVEVLHRVDLEVPRGQIVALLGANGAGKSTLCAVASGLVLPTEGRVVLEGEDVSELPTHERAQRGILLVPEARGIFPGLTVEENLRVLLTTDEEQSAAFARFPILKERRRQLAGLLSGGEQQMLSLAPVLARPPKVFIADEPTLGLAPLAAEEVVRALSEIRERGSSILLVEEKAREVMALADVVAFMELGELVWTGPRDQADEERLASAYLGGGAD